MENFEKYSKRFVKKMNSDLLVIYHRITNKDDERVILEWEDISAITELISDYSSQENPKKNENLTILIQTQGGVFQCAFPLMKKLREIYSQQGSIKSAIFTISKSSGAFIAFSSCKTYMDEEACVSNFSMNEHLEGDVQQTVQYILEAQDIFLNTSNSEENIPKKRLKMFHSLVNSAEHAKDILFSEAKTKYDVCNISDFGEGDWHLQEIANDLKYKFDENKNIKKIIGFNGEFIHFPKNI